MDANKTKENQTISDKLTNEESGDHTNIIGYFRKVLTKDELPKKTLIKHTEYKKSFKLLKYCRLYSRYS